MVKKKYLTAKTYKNINKAKKEKVVFQEKEQNKAKKLLFPSIFRMIPEKVRKLNIFQWVSVLISVCFFMSLIASLVYLGMVGMKYQSVISHRDVIQKQQYYWEGIVRTYPDYKDAYVMLATINYQLGDKNAAQNAIGKALEIDPNDKRAQELKEKLEKKR